MNYYYFQKRIQNKSIANPMPINNDDYFDPIDFNTYRNSRVLYIQKNEKL